MTDESIRTEEVTALLDWAWDRWKNHRPWRADEKRLLEPREDSARDDHRLLFPFTEDSSFIVGVRPRTKSIRVGLVTTNRWVSEAVEQAVLDSGGSMTEFLEDEMEADDDLEYPMLHYHDSGEFYFISELPYENLEAPETYDRTAYYFEGYILALEKRLSED